MTRTGEGRRASPFLFAMSDLHEKVRHTIKKFDLLRAGDTVVVAVSGGADSVALLHLLRGLQDEYALALHIAHLNHRLRPEAGADAEFVRQMAVNLGIPVTVEEVDVTARAAQEKRSLEDAGRQARYEFFARVAASVRASRVATAHTQDDQVETVAMRFLRGVAWEMLAGIPASRRLGAANVVRPLLETPRAELLGYLRRQEIAWRDDVTNRDQRFLRNWVRLTWLPALEARHPQSRSLLLEMGTLARDADRLLAETAAAVLAQAHREGRTIQFALDALRELPPEVRQRVIRLAASQVCGTEVTPHDVIAVRVDDVVTAHVGQEIRLRDCVVRRGYQTVEVSVHAPAAEGAYVLPVPGAVDAGDFGVTISAEVVDRASLPPMVRGGVEEVYLDASVVGSKLAIRSWRPGDKIAPLGLGGTKKVHDIFVDGKIPRWERSRIPLVTGGDGRILWVVGAAIADAAKVTTASTQVVWLRAKGLPEAGRIGGAMAAGVHQDSRRFQS